jgi:hypothetical protein
MALAPGTRRMSNPVRILTTLDRHLSLPAEITLFGRSAIALGFSHSPDYYHNTLDVDGILPLDWLEPTDGHQDFWQAVQQTNLELESEGLYLTHLFRETDFRRIYCDTTGRRRVLGTHCFSSLIWLGRGKGLSKADCVPELKSTRTRLIKK